MGVSPRTGRLDVRLNLSDAAQDDLDQVCQRWSRKRPATRAANLALRQRLRVEIVLAAINRRMGDVHREPRHNR